MTYSHMAEATLPSAQNVFTSEFGMGSGGSRSLWPPGKLFETHDAGVATGVTRLQSGRFFALNAIVAFAMMMQSAYASTSVVKPLEVIWSSLTGN